MSQISPARLAPLFLAAWLTAGGALAAEIPDIPFDEFYLDNGLRVIVHEDRKAPIVAVTLIVAGLCCKE